MLRGSWHIRRRFILISNANFHAEEDPSSQIEKPHILIIEDNEGDEDLLRLAFLDSYLNENYRFVHDGEQALDYLFKLGDYKGVQTPNLIVLDLQLPRVDGYEILTRLKASQLYAETPVIIFTGKCTSDCRDICETNPLLSWIEKPYDPDAFNNLVRAAENIYSKGTSSRDEDLQLALGTG